MGKAEAQTAVFVDPTGRRHRRVRRLTWTLALAAAGYVAITLASLVLPVRLDALSLPGLGRLLPGPAAPLLVDGAGVAQPPANLLTATPTPTAGPGAPAGSSATNGGTGGGAVAPSPATTPSGTPTTGSPSPTTTSTPSPTPTSTPSPTPTTTAPGNSGNAPGDPSPRPTHSPTHTPSPGKPTP